jgi:hypothetical protein
VPITGATMFEIARTRRDPIVIAATGTLRRPGRRSAIAAGGFSCERVIPVNNATTLPLLAAGDINADGIVDFIVGDPNTPTITVLRSE